MHHALNPTLRRALSLCGLDRTWVRGEGASLSDASGRRFLDFYAQYGAVALGHNAPAVTAAVRAALDEGEPAMVQPYRAPHAEALADRLAAVTGLSRCVFTTSGAEAVEAAIKLVRARTGRPIILSAEGSFHGKTLGALAATGQRHHAHGFGPEPAGFARVPYGDAEALAGLLAREGDRVAGLLLEPIQGERGVHSPPPGYLTLARELCSRYGVALILDEIQTGLGRTGALFAFQDERVQPDLLVVAKALGGGLFPLGACLSSEEFWDDHFGLRHSSTFANNNVACRVGLAVLEALTQGTLCRRAARQGERLRVRLAALAAHHPRTVAAVRGRGLMQAVELAPVGAEAGLFLSYLFHQGLLAYAAAGAVAERSSVLVLPTLGSAPVLRLTPPLVVTDEETDRAVAGLDDLCALLDEDDASGVARALGATAAARAVSLGAEDRTPLRLPSPTEELRPPGGAHRYAFLVHYTRREDVVTTDPSLARLSAEELERFCTFAASFPAGVILRTPPVRSALDGSAAEGWIVALGMLPEEMARRGLRAVRAAIVEGVDLAASLGAQVVGLGGFTTPYSRRGRAVVGRGPSITTGNTLTAVMAVGALTRAAEDRGVLVPQSTVAVVGARGSIGALATRLLARARPHRLLLVGNPTSGSVHLERLREELTWGPGSVEVTTDLGRLAACHMVLSATGSLRPALDGAPLRSRAIVCDVARPPDASRAVRDRCDLTVIDGGLVALPGPPVRFGAGNLQGFPDGVQLACLSETILLALAGETEDHGVGDDIPLAAADRIAGLAERHGFHLASPSLDGKLVAAPPEGRAVAW